MSEPMRTRIAEQDETLLLLVAAPAIWVLHFLLAYATAAIYCEKTGYGSLVTVRVAIAVYTVVALPLVAWLGWLGHKRQRSGDVPHAGDTPEDRHRFLGFATMLLAGLSALAIVYETVPALFLTSCQ